MSLFFICLFIKLLIFKNIKIQLKLGNALVRQQIHPTSVMAGFRLASREATKYIKQHLAVKSEGLGREVLVNAARTAMSSKIIGAQSDFYAELAVKAALRVKRTNAKGKVSCPISSINVLKAHGKSATESEFVEGYALNWYDIFSIYQCVCVFLCLCVLLVVVVDWRL